MVFHKFFRQILGQDLETVKFLNKEDDIKQDTDKSFFFDSRRKTPQIYSIKPEHK